MSAAAAAAPEPGPVLSLQRVRKEFGGLVAIEEFSLDLYAGEIVALVGDNGAGKSTLVKLISGVHQPTAGSIAIDGQPVSFADASAARRRGIEVVYQDLALADSQPVFMNMFLGRELVQGPLRRLDKKRMAGCAGVGEADRLAVDGDAAGGRLMHAGDQLHQRRLAGAIVADQRHDLAGVEVERELFDGDEAAELLAHPLEAEHRPEVGRDCSRRAHAGQLAGAPSAVKIPCGVGLPLPIPATPTT